MVQVAVTKTSVSSDHPSNYRAMAMVTTLFFMWGFLTALNDILIPHLKSIFDLNYTWVMLINSAFFGGYFVFAVPSGKLIEKIGYKKTMVVGLLVMAVGALLFVPAANVPSFPLFLAALIVLAAGVAALQVAANPYVTVLGPARTASSRLNLTQAFNSLGTTIAPAVGGYLILAAQPAPGTGLQQLSASALLLHRQQEASTVKLPYIGIALALTVLALAIAMFNLPKIEATREFRPMGETDAAARDLWKQRQLVLGTLGIFLYVGAEVAIGSFLINYFTQPEIGHMTVTVRRPPGLTLLVWRHDRPLYRRGRAAEVAHACGSRHRRDRGLSPGGDFHAQRRLAGDGHDHCRRALQLRDVPQYFLPRSRGPRAVDGKGLRPAGDGDCRRRDYPPGGRRAGRPHWHSPRLHFARALLHLYSVLRIQGLGA